ncbi:MAG TPA: Ig-like domain repeat protein [Nakamurella sp.]|nr:Ig-like domain repeat protein [Nakamurella sp.]
MGVLLLALSLLGAVPATAAPAPASASAVASSSITDLTASAHTITYGQYIVVRYNVSSGGKRLGGAQTTVTYGGTVHPVRLDGNGHAALGISDLPVGAAKVIVRYAGDATHGPASASLSFSVAPRPTAITDASASAYSITYGQYIVVRYNLTSQGKRVAGARTAVTYGGKTRWVNLDGNGHAALGISDLPVGNAKVLIRYFGDSTRAAASTSLSFTVVARPTAITDLRTSASSVMQGQSVVVRYTLTSQGRPLGSARTGVTYGGKTVWVTVDGNGRGAVSIPDLPAGQSRILVRYFGDKTHGTASASTTVTVTVNNPCPATAKACVDLTHDLTWLQSGGSIIYGPVPMTSGRPGYRTPAGTFHVYWKDKDHKSSIFNDAPMPNSIFFNGGVAFHEGSVYVLSHGCIHLTASASQTYWDYLNYGDEVYVFGYAPY